MISVSEADQMLRTLLPKPEIELVELSSSVGRILLKDVLADRDGPPFSRVAMDGWALRGEGSGPWDIAGRQVAGEAPTSLPDGSHCIEVATGAVLPNGADRILPYEDSVRDGNLVRIAEGSRMPKAGRHVHSQGHDYKTGQILIATGTKLRSPHLHTLATVGINNVPVRRQLTWALATSGNELVEVSEIPLPWQIRRSNAAAIIGEASAWGLKPTTVTNLPDDARTMSEKLFPILASVDVLILTGGVSAGMLDLVPQVLEAAGATTIFHRVAQRPGKPLWAGTWQTGTGPRLAIGLPGNPVSSLFAFRRYVLPWLLAAEGRDLEPIKIPVSGVDPVQGEQTVFLPWSRTKGILNWRGSGDFLALEESDGFLEIDSDPGSWSEPKAYLWGGRR